MTLKVQKESLTANLPAIKWMLPLHWEELALNKDKVPLSPQYDRYIKLDDAGSIIFITLRECTDDRIVGYFIGLIHLHLHYSTCLQCTTDIFFVHPDFRKGRAGVMLFKKAEEELKKQGVSRWIVGSKNHKSSTVLFKYLGFDPIEEYYSKWIGE